MLDGRGVALDTLTIMPGVRGMEEFFAEHRPQHAELDELVCRWGPSGDAWEFAVVRRMQRHGHPVSELILRFGYAAAPDRRAAGEARASTWQEVRELDGYRAARAARVRYRRLDQS